MEAIIGHIDNFDFDQALAALTANESALATVDAKAM